MLSNKGKVDKRGAVDLCAQPYEPAHTYSSWVITLLKASVPYTLPLTVCSDYYTSYNTQLTTNSSSFKKFRDPSLSRETILSIAGTSPWAAAQ